ncbi:hypothetical protein DPB93_25865, partial [Salmonella enterica subsp. salamae]|nr:hypothetical protein [Salmonella enterica subsp. salamae]
HCITGIRSEIYDFIGGFIHLFKQLFYVQIVLVQRAPRSVDSFRIKAATVLMLWRCKAPDNWLQFIHNPDELSGNILTVVYITGSLQHILCIIQLIAYQLQLMINMLQLM